LHKNCIYFPAPVLYLGSDHARGLDDFTVKVILKYGRYYDIRQLTLNMIWIKCMVRTRLSYHIMHALFFDIKGHVFQIPVPECAIVTGQFCATKVLSEAVKHYNASKRTGTWGIHLLHDNAPAHKSAVVVKEYIDTHGIKISPHPP
jgi:hypothetical protein